MTKIEKIINEFEQQERLDGNLTEQERTSWAVYDLNLYSYLAEIRCSEFHQSACISKPLAGLAAHFKRDSQGKKVSSEEIELMRLTIVESENVCERKLIEKIGGLATIEKMFRQYPNIFGKTKFIELPKDEGNHYKNRGCARDYVSILKAMFHNKLVGSSEVLELMGKVRYKALTSPTSNIPSDVRVYNKTGSNGYVCGDMAIINQEINLQPRPYIIVGLISRKNPVHEDSEWYNWWQDRCEVLGRISGAVYQEMLKRKGETK